MAPRGALLELWRRSAGADGAPIVEEEHCSFAVLVV
jgi:hypothetical protein